MAIFVYNEDTAVLEKYSTRERAEADLVNLASTDPEKITVIEGEEITLSFVAKLG